MDDEEDLKKMIDLIKSSREDNTTQDFQYDDFINCDSSEEENEETAYFDQNCDFNSFSADIAQLSNYGSCSSLKPDERQLIDSCSDPELKNLLILNRKKNYQLMQLYKKLKDLLIQSQKDIIEKRQVTSNFVKSNKEQSVSSGAWRLAAPYFKDKQLYFCPRNADTVKKMKNKELSIYELTVPQKWSSLECEKVVRAVKLNYNINQQNSVLKKIKSLEGRDNNEEIEQLKKRMEELQTNDNSEIPPRNSDKYIDWMRISELFLQDRRTAFECKSFWHIYLHPEINKSPWTPEENGKLKTLVKKYKFQNWDKIAEELRNNRSGFTACMNYYSNLHERIKRGEFTYEEDSRLVELVHKHRMGNYIPWGKIVQHFKNRTRSQIHHRYTYYLTQHHKKKGKFSDAEDILLMILVDRFGKNFKKCSEYLPCRSMVQIKSRYNSNLQNKLKKGSFTLKEDKTIMKYVEERGQTWSDLAKMLQRCRGQVRQRYNIIASYLKKKPNATLVEVPRRKHNMSAEEDSFNFLRMVADQFVDCPDIPTEEQLNKLLKNKYDHQPEIFGNQNLNISQNKFKMDCKNISALTTPLNVDDMLTNFFCNSFKTNWSKCISSKYVKKAAKDVQTVLDILKAKLDIPENFDEDERIDNLDVAILNILTEKNYKQTANEDINELIPPNLNSVIGLRSLLIKYYTDQEIMENTVDRVQKKALTSKVKCSIAKHLMNLTNNNRLQVEHERSLFYKRFQALFKWPSIMTLENPTPQLQNTAYGEFIPTTIQATKTYSRLDRNKSDSCHENQKNKINPEKRQIETENCIQSSEAPSSSKKVVPLMLTKVTNRSVIEDLMQNKNKKLFCMQPVKCGKETKMVIKEIEFHASAHKPLNVPAVSNESTSEVCSDLSQVQIKDISLALPETNNEPVPKRRKLSKYLPEREESIILNNEPENYTRDDDECNANNISEDLNDLQKLERFIQEQAEEVPNENDDLEDLRKLENFLKHEEIAPDFLV